MAYSKSFRKGMAVGLIGFIFISPIAFASTELDYQRAENIFDKIAKYADHFNIPRKHLIALVACETGNTYNTFIQSDYIQPYGREESWGLIQFHLPAHPEITKEQATDPDFALWWAGQHWGQRHKEWKTCARGL